MNISNQNIAKGMIMASNSELPGVVSSAFTRIEGNLDNGKSAELIEKVVLRPWLHVR